jgi:hypothetical protein
MRIKDLSVTWSDTEQYLSISRTSGLYSGCVDLDLAGKGGRRLVFSWQILSPFSSVPPGKRRHSLLISFEYTVWVIYLVVKLQNGISIPNDLTLLAQSIYTYIHIYIDYTGEHKYWAPGRSGDYVLYGGA